MSVKQHSKDKTMNYRKRVRNVGAALQTLKSFAKDYDSGEGTKAMINTLGRRMCREIGTDNFGQVLSEMDGDFYQTLTEGQQG